MKKDELLDTVEKEKKRIQDKRRGGRGFWQYVISAGSVGWMVALPAFGGAFLGRHLDKLTGVRGYWTLSLMLLGLAGGILWVWYTNFRRGNG